MSDKTPAEDSGSNRTGPVIFANPIARKQLLLHGEVVTARASDRTVGKTDAREGRNESAFGYVDIQRETLIPLPDPADLQKKWVKDSGFPSRDDWWEAIEELHGDPDPLYLFRAELCSVDDEYAADLPYRVATRQEEGE